MCYHVAIVVELRANIANYFDLKKVKGLGCKKQRIQGSNFNYFLKAIPLYYGCYQLQIYHRKKTNLVGRSLSLKIKLNPN
jgi:hypothetical protein